MFKDYTQLVCIFVSCAFSCLCLFWLLFPGSFIRSKDISENRKRQYVLEVWFAICLTLIAFYWLTLFAIKLSTLLIVCIHAALFVIFYSIICYIYSNDIKRKPQLPERLRIGKPILFGFVVTALISLAFLGISWGVSNLGYSTLCDEDYRLWSYERKEKLVTDTCELNHVNDWIVDTSASLAQINSVFTKVDSIVNYGSSLDISETFLFSKKYYSDNEIQSLMAVVSQKSNEVKELLVNHYRPQYISLLKKEYTKENSFDYDMVYYEGQENAIVFYGSGFENKQYREEIIESQNYLLGQMFNKVVFKSNDESFEIEL